MAESRPTLKISISRGGEITADGEATTLEALVPRFRDLAAKQGIIWYYSGASKEAQPHPNALKVLKAILEQKLLVRESSKPDFSDVVLVAGRSDGTIVSPQSVILPAEFGPRLVQSCWGGQRMPQISQTIGCRALPKPSRWSSRYLLTYSKLRCAGGSLSIIDSMLGSSPAEGGSYLSAPSARGG